ncbi:MAG: metallophosphatase family protein [Gammaproteobacteria bacterium]|nr:metallophosphatase family protein [Gammaproteobacteria bacterium]
MKVGVISDTHRLLRESARETLAGVDLIVHAGDVGAAEVLQQLALIAPVMAVRGNIDTGEWAADLPATRVIGAGGRRLYLLHNRAELALDPAAEGYDAVIYGHSHKPAREIVDGVLYLNPGSAGPRRFRLPIALATLTIGTDGLDVEQHELAA